jgi:hypothetical protein
MISLCSPCPLWLNFHMRYLITLAVLAIGLLGCAGESKHPTWPNATGAEQHERLMWKAIQVKNWADVESHLSSTFIGVNAEGQLFDRAGWLQLWKTIAVPEFSLGEVLVQPEGPNMKVTYVLQLSGNGTAPTAGVRVVSVWQQAKKGWILTATSMTPIQSSANPNH